MEIDTSNLTDEQISKLSEFVHTMEKENKATKNKHFKQQALKQFDNLMAGINAIRHKLEVDGYIENDELVRCFKEINESHVNGALKEVTKE